ncbi:MAG TPA: GMC family oxidoreductase [Polyangia bacterium]|nr:GMC family oxidoreductase [Polyangia bacterium]
MNRSYDYVVVGGGSAGCIVAAELAKRARVLVLEGGPRAEEHPETLIASGYKDAFINDAVMGERFTVRQKGAARQRVFAGTGTVMGGSGSVNGMVYTRGARVDYAEWPEGWRWDDVQDDFVALEKVLRPNRRPATAWTEACISAATANGFVRKEDLNDGNLSNVIGYEWMSYEGEDRRSSYVSFIKDAGAQPNLDILTGARAHRLRFDADKRVVGVEYERAGALATVEVRREVVLSAGALESPKLLLLSGVGPADHLRALGIDVVADRPSIGTGLHDHPNVPVFYRADREIDCRFPQLYSFYRTNAETALPKDQSDTCYVYWPAPSAMKQMVQRMLPPMVVPAPFYGPGSRDLVRSLVGLAFQIPAVQRFTDRLFGIILILGKPKSRGTLRLASADAARPALIDPAYYADAEDLETMVRGVRIARQIGGSAGLKEWGARELLPGKRTRSDESIARYVRKNTITTYHFAGTCAMGAGEADAVDTQLRVRGVRGVRVADASAIPVTPVSALNAPSMLIGYRCAKMIAASGAAS